MLDQVTLFVVVDNDESRRIFAVCESAEEAEKVRGEFISMFESSGAMGFCATDLSIHAMNAVFPGDRYRLIYGAPESPPTHPLEVPKFRGSKVTNTDAHSEGYLYPDDLFVYRREALAVAAKHNCQQMQRPESESLDWAVVIEIGEPLWRRYRSECLVRNGVGWEDTDLVRPVRVVHPTEDEVGGGSSD